MTRALALSLALLAGLAAVASAHDVRPAYLRILETDSDTCELWWKVPARGGDERLALDVKLPSDAVVVSEPRGTFGARSYTEHWSVRRPGGLAGATIQVAGLRATVTDVLVRVEHRDGTVQTARLTPAVPSFRIEAAPGRWRVAGVYLWLGIEHILGGIDHLLFVLALLMIVGRRPGVMVKTVTAFTVAHSITLGLAALGRVRLPGAPVEAVIALSVMFVAAEVLHRRAGRPGVTARAPWAVVFTFGLLHGFGFAGGLAEIGLPQREVPIALLTFNVGVEAGQLLFIAGVGLAVALMRRIRDVWPAWMEPVPAYAIGGVAAFWTIERIAGF